jgi:hypothetical protein
MKKTLFVTIFFVFLFIALAFAEISIKAEVDKVSVATDEAITYKLTIVSSEKKIPYPKIAQFTGFKVISHSQSSTFSFVKNNAKTIIVYKFMLLPVEIGKLKIEPSLIKIKDKTYFTESFAIEVRKGKAGPGLSPPSKPSSPKKPLPASQQPQVTL